jgi:hypothetical protein
MRQTLLTQKVTDNKQLEACLEQVLEALSLAPAHTWLK